MSCEIPVGSKKDREYQLHDRALEGRAFLVGMRDMNAGVKNPYFSQAWLDAQLPVSLKQNKPKGLLEEPFSNQVARAIQRIKTKNGECWP